MSRIGKLPVAIPEDVNVELTQEEIVIKGKLGELRYPLTNNVTVAYEDNQVTVQPKDSSNQSRAQWGTSRSNIANMVKGVTDGFEKELEITGVGYRASVEGKFLKLALGFSHDILVLIPEDITIKCPKQTEIIITGLSNQKVGQVAAKIREFRPPEPYKGKGIKYKGEQIRRKEGKKK